MNDEEDPQNAEAEVIENEFAELVTDYSNGITCLAETLPVTHDAILHGLRKASKRLRDFEAQHARREQQGDKALVYINEDDFARYEYLTKARRNYRTAIDIVPQSFIVSLVSQYDAFLSELLKAILRMRPEMLSGSEKAFTFAQLSEFASLEDVKVHILEKEVEGVLRKSHTEQFTWMENKFGIPLRKGLDVWPEFVELTERRNLFVHTGGIVSDQYLKICGEHQVKWLDIPQIGDQLDVTAEYFHRAANVVFEMGVKLAHVLWRKHKPEELTIADHNLLEIAYEPLVSGNYQLARALFDFAVITLKKHHNDEYRRIFIINRALSYKWSGDNKTAQAMICAEDWSSTSDRFRLAESVILDDFDAAARIMCAIGRDYREVTRHSYRTWPLFKEFRSRPEFAEAFETVYGEPFRLVELEEESDSELGADSANPAPIAPDPKSQADALDE